MTTRYLDFVGGNDGNDGSSFANRKKTLASAISGLTGGDTIRVMASAAATSLGQTATWTNGSDTVTLNSAVTANISTCEAGWTASANVTATLSTTTYREGSNSSNLVIASGFTTGLAAYVALGGTIDFSAYQQISFHIRVNSNISAGALQIKLCSDAAGATPVNSVDIPAVTSGVWVPFTVDTAGALGASIQSVALYAASDPGSVTVNLDNILAVKAIGSADSLSLTSLISLNTDANTPWHTIKSINGTTVKLGCGDALTAAPTSHTGAFMGTTATATTYKRQPTMLTAAQAAGTAGTSMDAPINIEGGWDTTNMSTQPDISWLRAQDPNNNCISVTANAIRLHKLYVCSGGANGVSFSAASYCQLDEFGAAGCRFGWVPGSGSTYWKMNDGRYIIGCEGGINLSSASGKDMTLRCKRIWGAGTSASTTPYGLSDTSSTIAQIRAYIDEIKNCRTGLTANGAISYDFFGTTFSGNTTDFAGVASALYRFNNCSLTEPANVRSWHTKYGQAANDHRVYWEDTNKSIIQTATDQRHTASDVSWKFLPKTANAQINSATPMALSVAKIACPASEARTVSLWFRRTNTGLTLRLRVPGGQVAGVASDVSSSMAAAADTWEQLSVNFTPSEAGVVEVFAEGYGGTTYNGWVDDLSIS
jgi:hypothetical protein